MRYSVEISTPSHMLAIAKIVGTYDITPETETHPTVIIPIGTDRVQMIKQVRAMIMSNANSLVIAKNIVDHLLPRPD